MSALFPDFLRDAYPGWHRTSCTRVGGYETLPEWKSRFFYIIGSAYLVTMLFFVIQKIIAKKYDKSRTITTKMKLNSDKLMRADSSVIKIQGNIITPEYKIITEEEFVNNIKAGGFLEHAEIYGHRYGTPKAAVLKQLDMGKDVILEIEMQGALQVKENFPDGVFIFILPLHCRSLEKGSQAGERKRRRI